MVTDVLLPDDHDQAHDQEDHDRGDLEDRGPELELAEGPRRHQVDDQDDDQGDQHRDPGVESGEPVLHVESDRGQLGDAGEHPVEPVQPAGDVRGKLAVELAHVGNERTRGGAVQHQLSERSHQEVGDHADEGVAEQQRRSRAVQPGGGAQEETRSDGATDGDHLDVSAPETLLVADLLVIQRRRALGLRHVRSSRPGSCSRRTLTPSVEPCGHARLLNAALRIGVDWRKGLAKLGGPIGRGSSGVTSLFPSRPRFGEARARRKGLGGSDDRQPPWWAAPRDVPSGSSAVTVLPVGVPR